MCEDFVRPTASGSTRLTTGLVSQRLDIPVVQGTLSKFAGARLPRDVPIQLQLLQEQSVTERFAASRFQNRLVRHPADVGVWNFPQTPQAAYMEGIQTSSLRFVQPSCVQAV